MIILILIAKPLFLIVFGEKWLPSVPYFQILCIASIFLPLGTYNLNILKVKGRSDMFLRVEVIKKVIGVISLIICIPFGINAIVWSLCITNVFFAYLNGYFSGRFISYSVYQQIIHSLSIITISIIPFALVFWLNDLWFKQYNNFLIIIIDVLCYMAIYLPFLLVFNKALINDLKMVLKK